jgi:hypothetical protein
MSGNERNIKGNTARDMSLSVQVAGGLDNAVTEFS